MYLYFSNTVGVPPLPTVVGHQDKKGGRGVVPLVFTATYIENRKAIYVCSYIIPK